MTVDGIRYSIHSNMQYLADQIWDFAEDFGDTYGRNVLFRLIFTTGFIVERIGFSFLTEKMKSTTIGENKNLQFR